MSLVICRWSCRYRLLSSSKWPISNSAQPCPSLVCPVQVALPFPSLPCAAHPYSALPCSSLTSPLPACSALNLVWPFPRLPLQP